MGNLSLIYYNYCEESKQFKSLQYLNNSVLRVKELLKITQYLSDACIQYKVDQHDNIQLLS